MNQTPKSFELIDLFESRSDYRVETTEKGVILRNVKMLGSNAKGKKRRYTRKAMREAASLYLNKPVRANHYHGKDVPKIESNLGVVVSAEYKESTNEVRGDILLNPHNNLSKQVSWDAEHSPGSLGVSHMARGRGVHRDGFVDIDHIEHVHSVDIVSRPSTTENLFESISEEKMTIEQLKTDHPELYNEIYNLGKSEAEKAAEPLLAESQKNLDTANILNEQLSGKVQTLSTDYARAESELQELKESATREKARGDVEKKLGEKGLEPKTELVDALLNHPENERMLLIESMAGVTKNDPPNLEVNKPSTGNSVKSDMDAIWS